MIPENLVFFQLAQQDNYICIVELSNLLDASVSEVRHQLKALGDRVECDGLDHWRVTKTIVEQDILTESERAERNQLERTVEQAFLIAGKALKLLRDKRLYRETHSSFESYVKERFDFKRSKAYYLIDAYDVVSNLKCPQIVDNSECSQFVHRTKVLPTKESQCRPLAKLSPEQQREAWKNAVEKAGGKVPSARMIKEAVKELTSKNNTQKAAQNMDTSFREVNYTAGTGIEYTVELNEETYYRLQKYQDKIGSATKNGAIARLLNDAGL